MKQENLVWFAGNIIPQSEAKINILSPTSQFGANVFEGIRGYWSQKDSQIYIFRLKDHTMRLLDSIKMMRFENIYSSEYLIENLICTITANNFSDDIAIRQTVFLDGDGSWSATSPINMFIAPIVKGRMITKDQSGLHCCVSSWERINDNSLSPKIKMGANYMNSRAGQLEAKRNGYDSPIFLNAAGKVSEGPGACIFMVRDNILITPPTTASILESITRKTIIEIAENELNQKVEVRDIDRTELYIADELFFCGTAVEVAPIISVDHIKIGNGRIGHHTKLIRDEYFGIVRGERKDYLHYLTPIKNGR
ncbi:branched-chain amino acid transaminase [Akkermansiaceae bacterium]|nr:branched-chain amino acid transaminase [Akkermansiaceae bacterium]